MLQRFVRAPGQRFSWTQVSLVDGTPVHAQRQASSSDRRHGHMRRLQLELGKARTTSATVRGWVGFGIHTARSRYPLPMGVLETVSRTTHPILT